MALKHQATARRKWAAAIRQVETHFPPHLPPLLFLTDPQRVPDPAKVAAGLPTGSGVIYRHFGAQGRGRVARELSAVCYQRGLVLLIAADPELAEKVGADGVHWPEKLLGKARAWRGRFPLQTASAHSRRAIWRAEQAGMDAALVSAVFPSNSPSARRVMGCFRFGSHRGRDCLRTLAHSPDSIGNALNNFVHELCVRCFGHDADQWLGAGFSNHKAAFAAKLFLCCGDGVLD